MSHLEDYLNEKGYSNYVPPTAAKVQNPKGWEPGIVWEGTDGTITTKGLPGPISDWDAQLREWNIDPEMFEIVEPVRFSTWEAQTKQGIHQMWSYRAGLRVRAGNGINHDLFVEYVMKGKRPKVDKVTSGEDALYVALADWQLGKRDGGGTAGVVERIMSLNVLVIARIKELRRVGRKLGTLYVAGMGDIVENCDGHYAMQAFQVEYSLAKQEYL